MSYRVVALGLAMSFAAGASAALAQSATIRIEPRPVYGATITIEEGVRVYRPLPPERYVVVNPNNTPLNLGLQETRVTETRTSTSRSVNKHYYGNRWIGGWAHRPCIPAVGDRC